MDTITLCLILIPALPLAAAILIAIFSSNDALLAQGTDASLRGVVADSSAAAPSADDDQAG